MTKEQEKELRKRLVSMGISSKGVDAAVKSIKITEAEHNPMRIIKDAERCKDIMKYKPGQGKATLTRIGVVDSNFVEDGIPVYQEDIDMIKRSAPLAKKITAQREKRAQDLEDEKPLSEILDTGFSDSGADIDFHGSEPGKKAPSIMTFQRIAEDEMGMPSYLSTPESDEKIRRAAAGFTAEKQTGNKDVLYPGDITYSYSNILERMDDTHSRKNSDYGDAAYKGYKKFGDYYFLVQLHNKLNRLEELTVNNKKQQVNDESIDDTLLDMANYAVMYLESRHRND